MTLHSLLPHRDPLLLLDALQTHCAQTAIANATIGHRHALFLNADHSLPSWVSVELMAQTVAAWSGARAQLKAPNTPPQIGFLLGVRQYQAYVDSFTWGQPLTISSQLIMQDQQMGSFDCQVHDSKHALLAQARLTTYQPTAEALHQLTRQHREAFTHET